MSVSSRAARRILFREECFLLACIRPVVLHLSSTRWTELLCCCRREGGSLAARAAVLRSMEPQSSSGVGEESKHESLECDRASAAADDDGKMSFVPACLLNFMNMFGTGPLITMPLLFDATRPGGPQAASRRRAAAS